MSRTTTLVLAALLLGAVLAYVFLAASPPGVPAIPRTFLDFTAADVRAVDVKAGDVAIRFERDARDRGRWRLRVKDVLVRADSLKVEDMLNDLLRLEPRNRLPFADVRPEERERWALDRPSAEVTLTLGAPGAPERGVRVGFAERTLDGNHVWAIRDDDDGAWVVPVAGLQALQSLRPEDVRERRPAGVSSADVQSVRIERAGRPAFVAERASRVEWAVQEPYQGSAEPAAFEGAIARIVTTEVVQFVEDGSFDPDRYGLLEPAAAVTIRRQGSESPVVLLFGATAPDGTVYFAEKGEPSVYACTPAAAAEVFGLDPAALRDRNLLRIGYAGLETVEVVRPGVHWRILRVMERWDLEVPERVPAERDVVDAILHGLRSLEATAFLDGEDPGALGLGRADEAAGRVVVTATEDGFSRTLLFGRPRADGVPVRVLAGPGVPGSGILAVVDPAAIDAVARPWLDLRDREVLRVDLGDVRGLARRLPDGTREEWRRQGGAWVPGAGTSGEPDAEALSVAQAMILHVRCVRWAGRTAGGAERFGLGERPSSAAIDIILDRRPAGGGAVEEVRQSLLIGDPSEDGAGRYARLDGSDDVFVLPEVIAGGGELRPFLRPLLAPWRKSGGDR